MNTETETPLTPPQGIPTGLIRVKKRIAIIGLITALVLTIGGVVGYKAYTQYQAHQKALSEYAAALDAYATAVDELAPAADHAQSTIKAAADTLKSNDKYRRVTTREKELAQEAGKYQGEKPAAATLDTATATTVELTDAAAALGVATKDVQDIVSGLNGISSEVEKLLVQHHLDKAQEPYILAVSTLENSITRADQAYRDAEGRISDNSFRDELKKARDKAEQLRKELVNWRSDNPNDYSEKTKQITTTTDELNAHIKKVYDATPAQGAPLPTSAPAPAPNADYTITNNDWTPASAPASSNDWTPASAPAWSNDWTPAPAPAPNTGNTGGNGGWVESTEEIKTCFHGVLGQDPVEVPCP